MEAQAGFDFEGFEGSSSGDIPKIENKPGWEPTESSFVSPPVPRSPRDGGRQIVFPHCPRCSSYALYRRDNQGDFECLTCGQEEITDAIARQGGSFSRIVATTKSQEES
jgi:hypothetical protein